MSELLQKDTAKQPIEHTKHVGFWFYKCPVCGEKDIYAEKFSSECGQKFDWGNTQWKIGSIFKKSLSMKLLFYSMKYTIYRYKSKKMYYI